VINGDRSRSWGRCFGVRALTCGVFDREKFGGIVIPKMLYLA
jgi:hypothetical protein